MILLLFLALFVTGPSLTQQPNSSCYVVDRDMAQTRPCRAFETR